MTGLEIKIGDCLTSLRQMASASVHCCVTSPPYFGLRDYDMDGQIGLEESPQDFVDDLVEVFREVRRVLRDDGTLWLNLGDSYARTGGTDRKPSASASVGSTKRTLDQMSNRKQRAPEGHKPKDRLMIPARVAIALQADGWWLRDEIIWHKPNAMPFSGKDRTTPAHEMIYMLSKSSRYFYDHEAVREDAAYSGLTVKLGPKSFSKGQAQGAGVATSGNGKKSTYTVGAYRNRRSVWTVTTKPFKGAHFATFPPDLIEPCILAGSPIGGTVLDPFGGSGTTAGVAIKHGRRAILCELNPGYAAMIPARVSSIAGAFVGPEPKPSPMRHLLAMLLAAPTA